MERTEFSVQAAVEEIYRVLTTSECPPPPSATQDYRVRASVDLDGEAVTPSFRVLPQSAKIKEICDRLSGRIGDPDNAKAFFTESQVPASFSGHWYKTHSNTFNTDLPALDKNMSAVHMSAPLFYKVDKNVFHATSKLVRNAVATSSLLDLASLAIFSHCRKIWQRPCLGIGGPDCSGC